MHICKKGIVMEEHQAVQNHSLILKNRNTLQLSGVTDVISFDSVQIILETCAGMLLVKGNQLHMSRLTVEQGEVNIEGNVDSLTYSDSHKASKQAGKIIGRLLK